jgi:hypothetical protein
MQAAGLKRYALLQQIMQQQQQQQQLEMQHGALHCCIRHHISSPSRRLFDDNLVAAGAAAAATLPAGATVATRTINTVLLWSMLNPKLLCSAGHGNGGASRCNWRNLQVLNGVSRCAAKSTALHQFCVVARMPGRRASVILVCTCKTSDARRSSLMGMP